MSASSQTSNAVTAYIMFSIHAIGSRIHTSSPFLCLSCRGIIFAT
jgi:hypothetical protein